MASANSDEFSKYYGSVEKFVPETTFNNMHGKIHDLESVDGQIWKAISEKRMENTCHRSKKKVPANEFKLNISGWWSKDDVWGTGGWNVSPKISGTLSTYGKNELSWKKYDISERSFTLFLQHLAQLTWPEQRKFKDIFDKFLKSPSKKSLFRLGEDTLKSVGASKSHSLDTNKRLNLPQSIGLKQLGRSIKYMTAAEKREEQKKKGKK